MFVHREAGWFIWKCFVDVRILRWIHRLTLNTTRFRYTYFSISPDNFLWIVLVVGFGLVGWLVFATIAQLNSPRCAHGIFVQRISFRSLEIDVACLFLCVYYCFRWICAAIKSNEMYMQMFDGRRGVCAVWKRGETYDIYSSCWLSGDAFEFNLRNLRSRP